MSVRMLSPAVVLFSVLLSGCLSWFNLDNKTLDLTQELSEVNWFAARAANKNISQACFADVPRGNLAGAAMSSLPEDLRVTEVMQALGDEYVALLNPGYSTSAPLNSNQFREFAHVLSDSLYGPLSQINNAPLSATGIDKALSNFKKYYSAYISHEGFTDSRGTKLSKPAITSKGIGNETISSVLLVMLEAVADSILETPVFCVKQGNNCTDWFNPGGVQPTSVKLGTVSELGIVPSGCGITESEARATMFFSELAAEQGEVVSGMILESFGGGEAGFVVAGHFSVGDNKTLATIVKTFFEHLFRRASTHALYEAFLRLDNVNINAARGGLSILDQELINVQDL